MGNELNWIFPYIEIFSTFAEGSIVLGTILRISDKERKISVNAGILCAGTFFYTVITTLMNQWMVFSFVTVALAVLYSVLFAAFFTGYRFNLCCTGVVLSWFFMNAVDYILICAGLMIAGHSLDITKGFEFILQPTWNRMVFLLTDKAVQFLLFLFLGAKLKKLKMLSPRNLNLLFALSAVAYVILNILTGLIVADSILKMQFAVFMAFLLTTVSLIAVIFVVSSVSKYQAFEREKELTALANVLTERNYKDLEKMQEQMRQIIHDYNNHLIAIDGLLELGGDARSYVASLLQRSRPGQDQCRSGIPIVDAIINYNIERTKEKQIDFRYNIRLSEIRIEPVYICSVLANQLDNAIEACDRIASDKRWIKAEIWQNGNFVLFKISNPAAGDPFDSRHELLTTKNDPDGLHGMGVKIISGTAEKLGGQMKNDYSDGVFTSIVMLQQTV